MQSGQWHTVNLTFSYPFAKSIVFFVVVITPSERCVTSRVGVRLVTSMDGHWSSIYFPESISFKMHHICGARAWLIIPTNSWMRLLLAFTRLKLFISVAICIVYNHIYHLNLFDAKLAAHEITSTAQNDIIQHRFLQCLSLLLADNINQLFYWQCVHYTLCMVPKTKDAPCPSYIEILTHLRG